MRIRMMLGILSYLGAILAPVSWLYLHYGPTTPVDPGNADHLVALAGSTVAAFALGVCASKISNPTSSSTLGELAEVLQTFREKPAREQTRT